MAQMIAVLVNRASLDRQVLALQRNERFWRTVDDHQIGSLQATRVDVFGELAPRRRALSVNVLDICKDRLPSRRTAMAVSTELFVSLRSSQVL